jgi:hypothetical protein
MIQSFCPVPDFISEKKHVFSYSLDTCHICSILIFRKPNNPVSNPIAGTTFMEERNHHWFVRIFSWSSVSFTTLTMWVVVCTNYGMLLYRFFFVFLIWISDKNKCYSHFFIWISDKNKWYSRFLVWIANKNVYGIFRFWILLLCITDKNICYYENRYYSIWVVGWDINMWGYMMEMVDIIRPALIL